MLTTIVAAIIVLGGLIFFHELGHFTVARWLGMGVSTFSLGFGPKLLKYRHGKTEYALSLVPLGGYVALVGENDENDIPSGFTREECFSLRPAWQRFLVIAAGPFANILLACILCWVVAWGWGNTVMLPQVGTVMPQSAAAQAGLQKGDLILSIDGQALSSWDEISPTVAAANGRPLTLTVARQPAEGMTQGTELELTLTPQWSTRKTIFGEDEKAWLIGIGPLGSVRVEELGFAEALETGLVQTWRLVDLTWQSFVKLAQRVVPADQVGGPIMIAQMVGQQAEQGLVGVLGAHQHQPGHPQPAARARAGRRPDALLPHRDDLPPPRAAEDPGMGHARGHGPVAEPDDLCHFQRRDTHHQYAGRGPGRGKDGPLASGGRNRYGDTRCPGNGTGADTQRR